MAEGIASVYMVVARMFEQGHEVIAERRHTVYDPLLGWCNEPGAVIEDMYGPGVGITINEQGFRGARNYSTEVPPGKLRIVCSGDSFTLGYGVDDDSTWSAVLEELDPRLETVNMGQGGYGTDQAFLWWRRDGTELDHDLHLFAFITGDISRSQDDHNYGYPKPVLRVVEGELVTENVPVPRFPYLIPYLAQNRRFLDDLALPRLGRELGGDDRFAHALSADELRASVLAMFDELARVHRERNSLCVAVHLPMKKAWFQEERGGWQELFAEELPKRGILYLDLLGELKKVERSRLRNLFIVEGSYPGAEGHYTAAGNRWAARTIHRMLLEIPAVAERLGRL